jgi:hypothetical protein
MVRLCEITRRHNSDTLTGFKIPGSAKELRRTDDYFCKKSSSETESGVTDHKTTMECPIMLSNRTEHKHDNAPEGNEIFPEAFIVLVKRKPQYPVK